MSDNTIKSDEIRITVEAGDDAVTTPRIAAALAELHSAIDEADADVEGFKLGNFDIQMVRVSSFSWGCSNPTSNYSFGASNPTGFRPQPDGDGTTEQF
jgi:hypothetical protein